MVEQIEDKQESETIVTFHSPFETSSTWNTILEYCLNPQKYMRELSTVDIDFILFRDKFPKAKLHLVMAPRKFNFNY